MARPRWFKEANFQQIPTGSSRVDKFHDIGRDLVIARILVRNLSLPDNIIQSSRKDVPLYLLHQLERLLNSKLACQRKVYLRSRAPTSADEAGGSISAIDSVNFISTSPHSLSRSLRRSHISEWNKDVES